MKGIGFLIIKIERGQSFLSQNIVAERVGFEPTVAKGYTRSPGAPDSPLQHLSVIIGLAERVGFEPTLRFKRRPLFESGTMNHSDTSPQLQ